MVTPAPEGKRSYRGHEMALDGLPRTVCRRDHAVTSFVIMFVFLQINVKRENLSPYSLIKKYVRLHLASLFF